MAQDRLRLVDDGRIMLTLKAAWADGTRHLVFEPLEFLVRAVRGSEVEGEVRVAPRRVPRSRSIVRSLALAALALAACATVTPPADSVTRTPAGGELERWLRTRGWAEVTDSRTRIEHSLFSILPPAGRDWFVLRRPDGVFFLKAAALRNRQLHGAGVQVMPSEFVAWTKRDRDYLERAIRRATGADQSDRFRIHAFELAPRADPGCSAYRYAVELRGIASAPVTLLGLGSVCFSSIMPALVWLEVWQTGPASALPSEDELAPFVQSFAVHVDRPGEARRAEALAAARAQWGRYRDAEKALLDAAASGNRSLRLAADLDERAAERHRQGEYDLAAQLYLVALAVREATLGPAAADVVTARTALAATYETGGQLGRAELMYWSAYNARAGLVGSSDERIAGELGDLVGFYRTRKSCFITESIYVRLVAVLAPAERDDPRVTTYLRALGECYRERGAWAEAEQVYARLVAILEKRHGATDLRFLGPLIDASTVYSMTGKYAQAEDYQRRAAEALDRPAPTPQPWRALVLHELGFLYAELGRYAEATGTLEKALKIWEAGAGKPLNIASTVAVLAAIHHARGDHAKAHELYRRAIELWRSIDAWTEVAQVLSNQALLYQAQGKHDAANDALKRALEIRSSRFGLGHPLVIGTLEQVARLQVAQRWYAEAESLYRTLLEVGERIRATASGDRRLTSETLGALYGRGWWYTQVDPLFKRDRIAWESWLGTDHPEFARVLAGFAELRERQGNLVEALALARQAASIRTRTLGSGHPETAASLHQLAELARKRQAPAEAEDLFTQALAIREKTLGSGHSAVAATLEGYASFLRASGRGGEAEPLEARARAIRAEHQASLALD